MIDRLTSSIKCLHLHPASPSPGTPAEVLGWGIWLANDRWLDRANTPSKARCLAHLQAHEQKGQEAGALEEGKDAGAR